jgi:hypothetical protein
VVGSFEINCPEVAGKRKKIKKLTFLIIFDRLICCDSLHNFARKRKFTQVSCVKFTHSNV